MQSTTNNGIAYCVGGVLALIVGIFMLGIPCGVTAIYLGNQGIKHGATTFGKIVNVSGWIETVGTALGIVAMIAAQSSGAH